MTANLPAKISCVVLQVDQSESSSCMQMNFLRASFFIAFFRNVCKSWRDISFQVQKTIKALTFYYLERYVNEIKDSYPYNIEDINCNFVVVVCDIWVERKNFNALHY